MTLRAGLAACAGALIVALAASCTEKSRSTDTYSKSFETPQRRVSFLCSYALCPSPARDALFHLTFRDQPGGLVAGPADFELRAVMLVEKDLLANWTRGCRPAPVEARPPWLDDVGAAGPFLPTSAPDGYRCGDEVRAIHVKDGLVLRSISRR